MKTVPIERALMIIVLGAGLYTLPVDVVGAAGSAIAAGAWMWPRKP